MNWVDIGINLTNRRYDSDRSEVIQAAKQNGVDKMIITGTSVKESLRALEIAETLPETLYATAGCHPHDAKSLDDAGLAVIEELAKADPVVAVGECGLDFNRNFSPKDKQIEVFKSQLELAVTSGKPAFLHERDAFDSQYQLLEEFMPDLKGAVAHCFTGTQKQLEKYLDIGLFIGITGWICDERRGQELYNIAKLIPDDRLMLETDGPYLMPRNLPQKPKDGRNEPRYLPHIAETVALARDQSVQHIAEISYNNSLLFFKLD